MRYASPSVQRAQQRKLQAPFKIPQASPKAEKVCEAQADDTEASPQHRVCEKSGHNGNDLCSCRWYDIQGAICHERRQALHYSLDCDLAQLPDQRNERHEGPPTGPHQERHVMLHEGHQRKSSTRNERWPVLAVETHLLHHEGRRHLQQPEPAIQDRISVERGVPTRVLRLEQRQDQREHDLPSPRSQSSEPDV